MVKLEQHILWPFGLLSGWLVDEDVIWRRGKMTGVVRRRQEVRVTQIAFPERGYLGHKVLFELGHTPDFGIHHFFFVVSAGAALVGSSYFNLDTFIYAIHADRQRN